MNEQVFLERLETGDEGTFGRVYFGARSLFTGELPDRGNAPNVSCIPPGRYECRWTYSPHFRRHTYQVMDVPGRSGIRIHSANLMGDRAMGFKSHLYGCIALGRRVGSLSGQKSLLVSRPAMREFTEYMRQRTFTLEIFQ